MDRKGPFFSVLQNSSSFLRSVIIMAAILTPTDQYSVGSRASRIFDEEILFGTLVAVPV